VGNGEASTPALEPTLLSSGSTDASERLSTEGSGAAARTAADALVGSRLRHFQLSRLLGRGGMGSVYLATDTSLERSVAMKVLAPEIAHDPEVVARFAREARAQARLRHPNVAQIYFIGEDAGRHFFVMEYVDGPSLGEQLADGKRLPWAEALEHAIATARGLRAALGHGFIHRDVKPSNLMVDREAGVKILDFGLVKSLRGDAELTRDGVIIGSPLYMAPEQGRGEEVDHRADIYSLGCALYHMLTGRPPFTGNSPVGVIAMHMSQQATPIRQLAPEVPESVQRIVDRMMAKDASARFPSYDALIAALESVRPGQRELSGFKTRVAALAVDLVPFAVLGYFLGPWVAPLLAAYFIVAHRMFGQTLGKRLLRLEVTDAAGARVSWKTAALRFTAFAWGPLAWTVIGLCVYVLHRSDRVSFQLAKLTARELALPLLYVGLVAVIFVGYLSGFLLAAFHPRRLALHDLLCRTEVRYKSGPPGGRVARLVRATIRLQV
jgi:uncharacterized RDD family membrane protein YckC/predicted Ser/Thr protein kinase